jgi:hypothetical protein
MEPIEIAQRDDSARQMRRDRPRAVNTLHDRAYNRPRRIG